MGDGGEAIKTSVFEQPLCLPAGGIVSRVRLVGYALWMYADITRVSGYLPRYAVIYPVYLLGYPSMHPDI